MPLMPAPSVSLYSMQGTAVDPGLVAYWFFPQRCTDTIRWLIVYVMLSRPRSLATLKSVNLTKPIREIIEQGPPKDLVANFDKLFHDKIEETRRLARQAAQAYGLLPEMFAVQTQDDESNDKRPHMAVLASQNVQPESHATALPSNAAQRAL